MAIISNGFAWIFLWILFSTDFLYLAKKILKIIDQLVWVFCKMHHLITFFFGLHLSLAVSNVHYEDSSDSL